MATTCNKPAGVPVFPPHGNPTGDCVLKTLLRDQPWRTGIRWPAGFEGGIAHRLDNATSGAVLAADDLAELQKLRDWFKTHRLIKTYLFRASKDAPWRRNNCDRPLAHHPTRKSRMVVQRGRNTAHRGKWYPAYSAFRCLHDRIWQVTITTGVTHQIRAHAAFLGIPIDGDRLYGGGDTESDKFLLHHVGIAGPDGFRTAPVPPPDWAIRK